MTRDELDQRIGDLAVACVGGNAWPLYGLVARVTEQLVVEAIQADERLVIVGGKVELAAARAERDRAVRGEPATEKPRARRKAA
jgi:hypothetical protein